jgi:hypothetical protein
MGKREIEPAMARCPERAPKGTSRAARLFRFGQMAFL